MGNIHDFIIAANSVLWKYVLIAVLLALGVFFTLRTNFVQFRYIKEMFRLLGESKQKESSGVSSFQAFCISIASRVGTGTIAGVAIAITTGGPGAIFWMWVIALIGAATGFIESTLGQVYKIRDNGGYRGGPAYYMEQGLNKRWLGIIFSILITITYGLVFNAVQANTVSAALQNAYSIDTKITGILLALLFTVVVVGGINRIARFTEIIVPIMAIAYVGVALFVMFKNITLLPAVFETIMANAFGFREFAGGGMGAALMLGIQRGLFSNEAGMGSAPNAAATAEVSHPVKQGLIQTLGVFTTTIIICSATAFMILCSDLYATSGLTGIELTQITLQEQLGGWASAFLTFTIFLFVFSSLIGNYYYGETNIEFLNIHKRWSYVYRIAVIAMIVLGSIAALQFVWDMADLFMGLMALVNLLAITLMSKTAFAVLKDFTRQMKAGKDPVFYADTVPGLDNVECWQRDDVQETKKDQNHLA
ncbi:alanine/glycine:cation symporter family protein [Priestia taiwanensis]|uniref:Sodium:alanine symporter n=1 Tax=Priestia taiwanensis TaxID=1347902 RepID=A0A917EPN9_9BACI|nr:alanine/glycine:cation symporter family protein [Priestia taiwanensis]MBM7363115.1 AGCS family alanine or glycine:cation symporter [Priestia taiwanensis]GGE67804.1 sodium:alanine symporter [Priestia taiwanensis]